MTPEKQDFETMNSTDTWVEGVLKDTDKRSGEVKVGSHKKVFATFTRINGGYELQLKDKDVELSEAKNTVITSAGGGYFFVEGEDYLVELMGREIEDIEIDRALSNLIELVALQMDDELDEQEFDPGSSVIDITEMLKARRDTALGVPKVEDGEEEEAG